MKEKHVIAIDARPLSRGAGGIQRYLFNILVEIQQHDRFKIILYCDHLPPKATIDKLPSLLIRSTPKLRPSTLIWQFLVPYWLKIDKPNLFWSPRHHLPIFLTRKTTSVVTIHDLVWRNIPKSMPKLQYWTEKYLMPIAIRNSAEIICVSKTTKATLLKHYPSAEKKCNTILHGFDSTLRLNKARILSHNYFLAVGTIEPRKNYENLIRGFDLYKSCGGKHSLTIVGRNGWKYKNIYSAYRESRYREDIKLLTDVNDETLSGLYSYAVGFISSSYDEGYGLPALEAENFGIPKALSNISVYRELFTVSTVWLEPNSPKSIKEALDQLETTTRKPKTDQNENQNSWAKSAALHQATLTKALKRQ